MGIFSSLSNVLKSAQTGTGSSSVGIDIGASSIKVVEIEDRDGVLTLLTYGEVQLGPYAGKPIGSVSQLTPQQEQAALVDVLRESAVKSRNAVFAMPLSASFISIADVQADPDDDLSAMVRIEARKLIPTSLSEVTLDWAELENNSKDKNERTVLIAAIQNSAIGRFKTLQQFAGFNNAPTEIECFSTNRAIGKKSNLITIDFGAASTKMYLSHAGVLNRMYRFNLGGADITKKLATELSVEFEEAEQIKLETHDGDKYDISKRLYEKQYHHTLREFKQVFDDYRNDGDMTFDKILICGGASLFPELEKQVADVFKLEVEHVNPFDSVAYPAFMEDTMDIVGAGFVPSIGSALRPFG